MDNGKRAWLPLRVPQPLKDEVQHLAWKQGLSANAMACALLRYALQASSDKLTLADRLAAMGSRK